MNVPTCSVTQPPAITGTQPVTATLTVNTQGTSTAGAYTAVVTGTSGTVTGSTTVAFTVTGPTVTPLFALSGAPISIASPGTNATSAITVTPSGGFTGSVQLTCAVSGGPTGGTESPNCTLVQPTAITGTQPVTATLTITTQTTTTPGIYAATISGTSGSLSETTSIFVTVNGPTATPDFALSGTAVAVASPGANGTSTITVTPRGGFTGSVALSCTVSSGPSGAVDTPACSVAQPAAVSGAGAVTSTMTITSKSTTTPGAYTATVNGAAGTVSHSAQLSITVNGTAATPSFSLSGSTITVPASAGTASSTITVTPSGGFTGTVTLACTVTGKSAAAVNPPTCSISQPPSIAGVAPVTASLTINTVLSAALRNGGQRLLGLGGGGTIAAALLLFCLPFRRRKWQALIGMLLFAVIVAMASGCGGGIKTTSSAIGTSAGTYTVTVTGTSGTHQSTAAIDVIVQ